MSHQQHAATAQADVERDATATGGPRSIFNISAVHQRWTTSGYPIVDGKYLDLATGTIKAIDPDEPAKAGPPALEVYWHNRRLTGRADQFSGFVSSAFVNVTEYLLRLGNFLKLGSCEVMAINATTYAINIIVDTELPREEMMARIKECNLFPALKTPNSP